MNKILEFIIHMNLHSLLLSEMGKCWVGVNLRLPQLFYKMKILSAHIMELCTKKSSNTFQTGTFDDIQFDPTRKVEIKFYKLC